MSAEDAARRYFEAWNARDPDAVAAAFSAEGVYADPTVPEGLPPQGTAGYAAGLFAAFPDLAFAIDEPVAVAGDRVVARWLMSGVNDGPFMGLPPTGRAVRVEGVDVIETDGHRVRRVDGYFDSGSVPRQLGLQVIVQPADVGPFSFGVSTRASVSGAEPGAMSLTVLEARDADEIAEVADRSRDVVMELLGTPGFISFLGVIVGPRMYTVTAWESPEDVERLRQSEPHREATTRFFGDGLAAGGQTGVWTPLRLNGMWVRCPDCGTMAPAADACACGAPAAAPPAYW
jgi:steroid delta-isomerase-like uncharacterized protein